MTSSETLGGVATTQRIVDPPRRRHRVLARLRAGQLDAQLADGRSPDDGGQRAARSAQLVTPQARAQLADHWQDVLARAQRPHHPTDPRVPLPRERILAAAPEILDLAACLRAAAPVPVRGVAMAHRLLTDGAGPLYRRSSPVPLRDAIAAVSRHLDPATCLAP